MSFKPYRDKIQVEPIEETSPFVYDDRRVIEAGRVVAFGEDVQGIEVGDVIFFLGYGAWKTSKYEDKEYWVVPNREEFILGKYVAEE